MSELLKLYAQSADYIPANQLRKLNDNLLKTYFRHKKDDIDIDAKNGNITYEVVFFYKFLDNDIKKKVIESVTKPYTDYHKYFDTELLKDYYLAHSEEIKKLINNFFPTITGTNTNEWGNSIEVMYFNLKLYVKYFDSDFLENINKKLVQHYLNISKEKDIKYFALEIIKILNEIGLVKFISSLYNYNYLYNTNNYKDVDDMGKRIQFLCFVIYEFDIYRTEELKKYFDIIKEKDMFELIGREPSYNIPEFLERIPLVFYEKFPQVFLDLLEKSKWKNLKLKTFMPLSFINAHGLSEKYGEYVETVANYAWKEIKKDIFESGFIPSKYRLMGMIGDVGKRIKNLSFDYNYDFLQQVKLKLIEYYEDEKESLNLK
jgi:hypothetical protein